MDPEEVVVDEAELKEGFEVTDDEDPVELDEKLPVDDIIDPLLPIDDEEEKDEDVDDDDKADMEALMWQEYDER